MANRKLLFVNNECEYEEEALSVSASAGSADAGKFITLDANGMLDQSFLPISPLLDWKDSVRATTTANIDIASAPAAIDGVTLVSGDRILVKDQTAGAENGIYVFNGAATPLTRSEDADSNEEVTANMSVFVAEGTSFQDCMFTLITNDPIVLDTTALSFAKQAIESTTGGDGINVMGNTASVDVVPADSGLEFVSGQLSVDFADTSVVDDLDGTNDEKPVRAEDLFGMGAGQGAKILGFDPTNCSSITSNTIQGAVDELCALAEMGASVSFTVGTGGVTAGDLVCIDSDDTVVPTDIMTSCRGVGIAGTTEAAAGTVNVIPNDAVVTGVISGATAGDVYYWDGIMVTTTKPTAPGTRVWQVGVAKNATDLYTDIRFVKVNS